eukprot:1159129-Pelagomonas_calceolata.AAC.16
MLGNIGQPSPSAIVSREGHYWMVSSSRRGHGLAASRHCQWHSLTDQHAAVMHIRVGSFATSNCWRTQTIQPRHASSRGCWLCVVWLEFLPAAHGSVAL